MPNVLIELGFITNSQDYNMLIKSKNRQKMAKAIFESIVTYKNKYENEL
jgi:N-acetylmuramoyl-L-alanine amidase